MKQLSAAAFVALCSATFLMVSSCSLFPKREAPEPPSPSMQEMEAKLLSAAQDRAIRKILGLPVPDGSVVLPSSK